MRRSTLILLIGTVFATVFLIFTIIIFTKPISSKETRKHQTEKPLIKENEVTENTKNMKHNIH